MTNQQFSNNNNGNQRTNNGPRGDEEKQQQQQSTDEKILDFISDEKLPDVWPEEFPGITRFAPSEPSASLQFDSGDIVLVNSLGNLAPGALIDELKAMHAIACRLTAEEEQEKTRGKILRVLLD